MVRIAKAFSGFTSIPNLRVVVLKDYYRTLGIPATAPLQEVKTAFRKQAIQFHPDKNPDNNLAVAQFREAQEAYSILGDERRRKQYDEARFFAGMASQKEPQLQTADWLFLQSEKLNKHMQNVDTDRMNHHALSAFVHSLLSDAHLAVLLQENDENLHKTFLENILLSLKKLDYRLLQTLHQKLIVAAADKPILFQEVNVFFRKRKKERSLERIMPFLVFGIALMLCLLMVFLYKK